jgi:peptidylprolyl isomerase
MEMLMEKAKKGDKVKVNYVGTLDDGTVFDSSEGREPLGFTVGSGQVISGFDEGATGLAPGEKRTVHIPADKAYGEYQDDLVVEVDRDQLPPDMDFKIGDQFQIRREGSRPMLVTVAKVADDKVTLDGNHPLAGKDLNFDIELVAIEQPAAK